MDYTSFDFAAVVDLLGDLMPEPVVEEAFVDIHVLTSVDLNENIVADERISDLRWGRPRPGLSERRPGHNQWLLLSARWTFGRT